MTLTTHPAHTATGLSAPRLLAMRGGYLLMGLGLAVVKWPQLSDAASMPHYEGVTLCLLTALSLLAIWGLRQPVRMLPVLVFESVWKILWLSLVALPRAVDGDLDAATTETLISCSLVVVIIAVTPWSHVWRTYVRATSTRA